MCNNRGYLLIGLEKVEAPSVQENLATSRAASSELISDNDGVPVEAVEMRRLLTCRLWIIPLLKALDGEALVDGPDELGGDEVDPDALGVEPVEDVGGAVHLPGIVECEVTQPAIVLDRTDDQVLAVDVGHSLEVFAADRDRRRRRRAARDKSRRSDLPPPGVSACDVGRRSLRRTALVPMERQRNLLE